MNTTQITLRTDPKTKHTISEFAQKIGLSTGAFMMAAAKDAMDRGQVTLRSPEYDQRLIDAIAQARAEYEHGDYYQPNTPDESIEILKSWVKDK